MTMHEDGQREHHLSHGGLTLPREGEGSQFEQGRVGDPALGAASVQESGYPDDEDGLRDDRAELLSLARVSAGHAMLWSAVALVILVVCFWPRSLLRDWAALNIGGNGTFLHPDLPVVILFIGVAIAVPLVSRSAVRAAVALLPLVIGFLLWETGSIGDLGVAVVMTLCVAAWLVARRNWLCLSLLPVVAVLTWIMSYALNGVSYFYQWAGIDFTSGSYDPSYTVSEGLQALAIVLLPAVAIAWLAVVLERVIRAHTRRPGVRSSGMYSSAPPHAIVGYTADGRPVYGNQMAGSSSRPAPTSTLAIMALVFGVVGSGIVAVVLGHIARGQIRRTGEGGSGMALAGLILGYAVSILWITLIIVYVVVVSTSLR